MDLLEEKLCASTAPSLASTNIISEASWPLPAMADLHSLSDSPRVVSKIPSSSTALIMSSELDLSNTAKWTHYDKEQLKEAQSDVVEMAHTALSHLEALKKKELLLAALLMTQEEFDKLAAEREKLIVESAALASNGNPLIFDAPNELIVGAADIENNSGDASSDTYGGGGGFMGGEEGV
jgi:hypothetical protein